MYISLFQTHGSIKQQTQIQQQYIQYEDTGPIIAAKKSLVVKKKFEIISMFILNIQAGIRSHTRGCNYYFVRDASERTLTEKVW